MSDPVQEPTPDSTTPGDPPPQNGVDATDGHPYEKVPRLEVAI